LTHFSDAIRPEPQKLPDEQTIMFQSMLVLRRQLINMLVADKIAME
jgi:hypothetical protein